MGKEGLTLRKNWVQGRGRESELFKKELPALGGTAGRTLKKDEG